MRRIRCRERAPLEGDLHELAPADHDVGGRDEPREDAKPHRIDREPRERVPLERLEPLRGRREDTAADRLREHDRQERDPACIGEECDGAGDEAVGEEALDDEHELPSEQRRDEDGRGRREQAPGGDSLHRVSRGRAVRLHGEESERRQLAGADRDRERRRGFPERQDERGDRERDSGSERDAEDRERVAPLGGQEGGVDAVQPGRRDQRREGEPDRQPVGRDGDQDRDVQRRPAEDERCRDPQRRVEQRARRARPSREAGEERGVEGLARRDTERDRDDQREEVGRAGARRAEQRGDDRDEDEREHALDRERGEGEDAELAGRVVGEWLLWRRFVNG